MREGEKRSKATGIRSVLIPLYSTTDISLRLDVNARCFSLIADRSFNYTTLLTDE